MTKKVLTVIAALAFCVGMQAQTLEAETMTLGGSYAGTCSSPFPGVALYGNGDNATGVVSLTNGSGVYNIKVTGASNNSTAAGVALYVGGKKMADMSFSGTAPSVQQVQTKLYLDASSVDVKLNLENDNGSNDTYIDKIEFEFVKALPTRTTPVLPQQSVWQSGQYRNILQEAGYSQEEINSKLQAIKQQFFEGDAENGRLYYELGSDEAYILDTGNDDVRTESLSYGMMICVQLNMQTEFDKLWRFTKNHSMHKSGANKGYLAWQLNTDGSIKDGNAAPDGDEYIATALMFAAGRWGSNTTGIDYWKEANYILDNMLSKGHYINSSHVNMFNADHQIVFVPYAQSAVHTDPSYHMPAFYELWSKWANNNRQFWKACADKSRAMYPLFAHETTGLMPDYAEFEGGPRAGEHAGFRYDAWRCAMHMATDYMWFKGSENEYNQTKKLLDFFNGVGVKDYVALYELNGNPVYGADHSPGLVGCNAVGAMISDQKYAWDFVDDFYEMTFPTGHYRYYDGCLYFLSYLHASGNFKMYKPAEVLATAMDEQYKWDAENGYLIVDNFENVPEGKEYYMRSMDNSSSAAALASDPKNASNHVLKIEPKSYDDYYYHEFRLPKEHALSNGYTAIEFDVLYDGATYNNETMKVFLNDYSAAIYTESTGAKEAQSDWKHVTASIENNTAGNDIVIGLGVRAGGGAYYIDNLKLKYTGAIDPGQGGNDPENNDQGNDDPGQGGGNDPQLTPETYPAGNILSEGAWGFENNDLNGWNSWAADFEKSVANTGYASDHCLKVENKAAAGMWDKQCVLALDNALEKGKTYTLTFKAKADVAANINTAITMKDKPWTAQGSADHSLTTEWAEYTFEQTIDMDNIDRIVFNLGETATSYYIDNISLIAKAGEGEPDPTPGGNDDPTPGPTTDSRNGTYFTDNDVKYYMIEDFEDKTVGTTTDMQNNGGTATVSDEHKMEGNKALRVNIGAKYQGNGCYAIDVTLPEGVTLSDSKFSAINFDIYYEAGSIQYKGAEYNTGVKVWLNDINNMIIQHDTKGCLGQTENIAVPLEGKFTNTNSFKLLIGGLCSDNDNDGIYYIDNIRLVCVNEQGDGPQPETYPEGNILSEGAWGFENGQDNGWNSWAENFERTIVEGGYASNYCLKVENKVATDSRWNKQAAYMLNSALTVGSTYTMTFKAKADVASQAGVTITMGENPWTAEQEQAIDLTTDWAEYTYEVTITNEGVNRIIFNLGEAATSYYFDNICLVKKADDNPGGGQEGDDPTPDSDAKKIVLDDFEKYAVGDTPYTLENANGGSASVVSADANNKALNFTTGSYKNGEYLALTFTLPQGKTLSDYDVLTFDYAFAASGNDNTWKDIKVCIDSKNTAVGTIATENAPAEWQTMSIALENVQGGNSFTLYIGGINANVLSMNIDNIVIKKAGAGPSLNAYGYATFSSEYGVQIKGAKAYAAKLNIAGDKLVCTEIEDGKVPAGVGVLLYGEANAEVTASYCADAPVVEGNELKATTLADGSLAPVESCLILSGDTFVRGKGSAFKANKAYLPYADASNAKVFTIEFGETTGINAVEAPVAAKAVKTVKNGKLVINVNGVEYNAVGAQIK